MKLSGLGRILALAITLGLSMATNASPDYWIDVRTEAEYAESHLENAVNIPHDVIREQIAALTTDKEAKIYLYCRSGGRAGIAMNHLQSMGYKNVRNVGGIADARKLNESAEP